MTDAITQQIQALETAWAEDPRWKGVERPYSAEDVVRLRPSLPVEHSVARVTAEKLWALVNDDGVRCLGSLTGAQAVQMVKGGLQGIYVSGWQVAADANLSGHTYPDQSLYPSNSVPMLVKRLNNALQRADLIEASEGRRGAHDYYVPIVADAEAGFGGPLHGFELMKSLIAAGAAGVHFEDQLAAEKKCGHLGGKVLVPTATFIRTLTAARLAADVMDVPTLLIARTDSLSATLLTSDIDERDRTFIKGERTPEGYYRVQPGLDSAIARGLAYAPYADLIWFETSTPDLEEARVFADALRERFPGKLFAYNCSPSFNWERNLDADSIKTFNAELQAMGYTFQFVTLAGWHLLNYHTFELARAFSQEGMPAYVRLQHDEFDRERVGYTATRHQREVGTGYFDRVLMTVTGGEASTTALDGSTEKAQFE